ncbi:MAG: PRD domain-containing protein [Hungatella hathewayi]|nr:PRD domain-containing protein [Hungatella hathewayi]
MLKYRKSYNNNVVLLENETGEEVVAVGRGISFKRNSEDYIEDAFIDKLFVLKDKNDMNKFQALVENIPLEYLEVADEIIKMVKEQSQNTISDSIYLTLIDHISLSFDRERRGIVVENPLLFDIKSLYKKEYRLALQAADIIDERLHIKVSDSEVGFITLHIVNASENQNMQNVLSMTYSLPAILDVIAKTLEVELNKESLSYDRLVRHLQFLLKRVMEHKEENEAFLLDMKFALDKRVGKCVKEVDRYIYDAYQKHLTKTEKSYLTLHIANILREIEKG